MQWSAKKQAWDGKSLLPKRFNYIWGVAHIMRQETKTSFNLTLRVLCTLRHDWLI